MTRRGVFGVVGLLVVVGAAVVAVVTLRATDDGPPPLTQSMVEAINDDRSDGAGLTVDADLTEAHAVEAGRLVREIQGKYDGVHVQGLSLARLEDGRGQWRDPWWIVYADGMQPFCEQGSPAGRSSEECDPPLREGYFVVEARTLDLHSIAPFALPGER